MNWADNSAYSVHDLEDGIKSGLLKSYLLNDSLFEKVKEYFRKKEMILVMLVLFALSDGLRI